MFITCVKLNNVLTFNHYKANPYCCTHDFSKLFELYLLNLRKAFDLITTGFLAIVKLSNRQPAGFRIINKTACYQAYLNDTRRENLCFAQISIRMAAWLLLTFFVCLHNQLSSIHSIIVY